MYKSNRKKIHKYAEKKKTFDFSKYLPSFENIFISRKNLN